MAKLAEEASELAAAVLQFLHPAGRDQDQALQNVLEELDDVEICLQQARIIFEHQRPFRAQKLKRLAECLPEPSIYPSVQVLLPDGTQAVVQDIISSWVCTGDGGFYNQDPGVEDFQPLIICKGDDNGES